MSIPPNSAPPRALWWCFFAFGLVFDFRLIPQFRDFTKDITWSTLPMACAIAFGMLLLLTVLWVIMASIARGLIKQPPPDNWLQRAMRGAGPGAVVHYFVIAPFWQPAQSLFLGWLMLLLWASDGAVWRVGRPRSEKSAT